MLQRYFAVAILLLGCNREALVADGGASRNCIGHFTGGASGDWICTVQSNIRSDDGTWRINLPTLKSGGLINSNVHAIQGMNLTIRGAPRVGIFDLNSPEVTAAIMFL